MEEIPNSSEEYKILQIGVRCEAAIMKETMFVLYHSCQNNYDDCGMWGCWTTIFKVLIFFPAASMDEAFDSEHEIKLKRVFVCIPFDNLHVYLRG